MGFTSHQQMHGNGGPPDRIAECPHFSRQHYGGRSAPRTPPSHTPEVAPKWASGSTWFSWVFTESAGLSFCVLVAISPHRAKLGGAALRDAPGRYPPADPRRWRLPPPAGPGPWQELVWQFAL
jgi:hypothetical protein